MKQWLKIGNGWVVLMIVLLLLFWISLPNRLFHDPVSTVVYDPNNELLGARIAEDGQWRFPLPDSLPEKYAIAVMAFEDRFFNFHPGVNPGSLIRAFVQNIREKKVVSGGSTITMQVIRMSGKNKPRTVKQKVVEIILALRYELSASKKEILKTYAGHAPFGGNVVGIEAASWRYFGTSPHRLTWSECALLAVLPNAPSLIHPGRNRDLLKNKRDRLLEKLFENEQIDETTFRLAVSEPLPDRPLPLPDLTPHLTDRVMMSETMDQLTSTIDLDLQQQVAELVHTRNRELKANEVHNIGCMVMEIESGEVLAYVGNAGGTVSGRHGNSVDVIRAHRSTGSILKPFLFAGMIDHGHLLQSSLVADVPVRYSGYAPKNYDRGYAGAVRAREALERSLNIPAVIMLETFGVNRFLELLRNLGFTTFNYTRDHYGLTLILGGAETTLWELTGVYSSLARVLNNYNRSDGKYFNADFHMPVLEKQKRNRTTPHPREEGVLSASSIYITFKSLLEVNRPDELSLWQLFSSSKNIAWKTGTSYGFRDAWAVGVTPEFAVGVWAGNADGEGRTGLTGITAAAPLMFDVFGILPETTWFEEPLDAMSSAVICAKSGFLAGPLCPETDTISIVPRGLRSKACPYHTKVHLDASEKYRVNSACYPVNKIVTQTWFVLPPLMEWYYRYQDPDYKRLPPVLDGCRDESIRELAIVYPLHDSHVVIPVGLDGKKGQLIMEVAHRDPETDVFWHIDKNYVGVTAGIHQMAVEVETGDHELTVVDENGHEDKVFFEVLK